MPEMEEIEVTPEMIEAGGAEFMGGDLRFNSPEEIATTIYRRMEKIRRATYPETAPVS